jgi:hypothetical protein
MRVLVAGSRALDRPCDAARINQVLDALFADERHACWTQLISGGAAGVDRIGEAWARLNGLPITRMLPEWDKYGRRAGLLRNSDLVSACECAVVFWDGASRGTLDTINKLRAAGRACVVVEM